MTLLYLNSNTMGSGDDLLGTRLLAIFLKKLSESDHTIDVIACVNIGIELTTQKGEALESLRVMESRGAQIFSYGTCLDFHDLRDKLLIGSVGNMEQSVEILCTADRVIRPC
ncbi:MAG: hypothetical protein K9N35_00720 [Candidatus Marinimicrobia bacterium]|nr:hypothetical protein [Candidatus Neomarinimicrobiota bacterium]